MPMKPKPVLMCIDIILTSAFIFCIFMDGLLWDVFAALLFLFITATLIKYNKAMSERMPEYTVKAEAEVTALKKQDIFTTVSLSYKGSVCDVACFESRPPIVGQKVGVYHTEADPMDCILKVYKEHEPGFSNITRRKAVAATATVCFLSIVFVCIGTLLLADCLIHTDGYDVRDKGVITSYIETDTYTPVLDINGREAVSAKAYSEVPFATGTIVYVRFNAEHPESVIIDDDWIVLLICGSILLGDGVCCSIASLVQVNTLRRRWSEITALERSVDYL